MIGYRLLQAVCGGVGIAAALATAAPILATPVFAQEAEIPLRIAAGRVSDPMFGIGGIIASIVSNPPGGPACPSGRVCGLPGLVGEARATAGSLANLESLAAGQSETAIAEADLLWEAANGFGSFAGGALGDLRALTVLYTESVMLVVRSDSPIDSIADLRGRAVAFGPLPDPHVQTVHQIMAAHGVRDREITQIHLTTDAAASALAFGEIDAAVVVAPSLPQDFRTVAERLPLRLLPIDAEVAPLLTERHPFLTAIEIGDLAEGRRRTPGMALAVLWVTTQRMPVEIGYGLVRTLLDPVNRAALMQEVPVSSAIAPESDLMRSPIPVHAGAQRYFEERSGIVR